jgi:hypothetical protein
MYRINLCNVFKINLCFCKGNTGTQIEQQLSGADKILVSRQSETFFSRERSVIVLIATSIQICWKDLKKN